MTAFLWFIAAACGSWTAGFFAFRLLNAWNVVDRPNQRSSHERPTARGGGIGIMLMILGMGVVALASCEAGTGTFTLLLAAALILSIVSFIDDRKSLPARVRFGCQAIIAIAVLVAFFAPTGALPGVPGIPDWAPAMIAIPLAFLWLTGYTNAFNFMDGINGIAAGQALVTAAGIGLIAGIVSDNFSSAPVLLAWIIAGAAAGFLPHNFPRARMFMGDVGSVPLGFLLAALTLWISRDQGWWLLLPLALLHANYVFDTGFTLMRRVFRGEKWYEAHKEHFYQRLVRAGKSHTLVTTWEMALQLVVLLLMVAYVYAGSVGRLGLVLAVCALHMQRWRSDILYRLQRRGKRPLKTRSSRVHAPISLNFSCAGKGVRSRYRKILSAV
jgi:UDP-N-acetylmuramyl pentapeptide phosphotransferase/UDP-N-acetylglucosamine-1-phosphate transferase